MNPLAPEQVVFFVALAAGVVLMFANALAGVDHGSEGDGGDPDGHDAGHDAHAQHDHEGVFGRALSALGVGRVPLLLVLTIFLTALGVYGFCLNFVFSRFLPPFVYGFLSFFLACFFAGFSAGYVARKISRLMPTTESYNVSKEDLVGVLGFAALPIDATFGTAQVRDEKGDVFKVFARTSGGEKILVGEGLVVVSYNTADDTYLVTGIKP